MSDLRLGQGPYFDRGIDSIVEQRTGPTTTLPKQTQLLPPEQAVGGTVERLLTGSPTLAAVIDHAVQPHIGDPELLLPHRFHAEFTAGIASLRQHTDRAEQTGSEDVRVLQRGDRACREVGLNYELLDTYLRALLAG